MAYDPTAAPRSWAPILAAKPEGAHAAIVAILREDISDSQSDYFASKTIRRVVIGWRMTKRESFKALHAAAAAFEPTKHLAEGHENRENYSMGHGNFLAEDRYSGWEVRSISLLYAGIDGNGDVVENGLPGTSTSLEPVFNCRVGRSYPISASAYAPLNLTGLSM